MKFLLFFLVFISTSQASLIREYESSILEVCPKLNRLIIKKSLIENIKDKAYSCDQVFTGKLIAKCEELNCSKIQEVYSLAAEREAGNVVGR